MAKILLLIENDFEDTEALVPYYRMQEAHFTVDVVGPHKGTYHSLHGYPLTANLGPAEIAVDDYAGIMIPGGQAPDRMRANDDLVEIVKQANTKCLTIGAICHGPQMLIEADIIRGRNVTCYPSILTDILNAGAIYHDLEVIIDDNLITSRSPADLPAFCREVLRSLQAK